MILRKKTICDGVNLDINIRIDEKKFKSKSDETKIFMFKI